MRSINSVIIVLAVVTFVWGQNEQAPMLEKEITYKNWEYRDARTNRDVSLRDLIKGQKLVIVVYFAPWCHNWQHDAPFLQKWYEKYHSNGLEIVGVSEYDPVESL